MGILKVFFNNTRKPEGLLGRCMVGSMNLQQYPQARRIAGQVHGGQHESCPCRFR